MAEYIFSFDRVVVNPTADAVNTLVEHAADTANGIARTRMVTASAIQRYLPEPLTEEGSYWIDGGGVPNSYRQRGNTSVLGVAWWTDANGNIHVRAVGGRVEAPRSAYARRSTKAFGLVDVRYSAASCVAIVYPILQVNHPPKKDKGLIPEILRELEVDPLDRISWMALADTLVDQEGVRTYDMTLKMCQQALTLLDSLILNSSPTDFHRPLRE